MTELNEVEKSLSNRIDELNRKIGRLELVYENMKKSIYNDYSELAKTVDELAHPDIHYRIVRR